MVIVLTPEAWSISGVKRHSMDYHSEVEIHERDDGGIVLDIHAKKNRGTLFVCWFRLKGASTFRKVAHNFIQIVYY